MEAAYHLFPALNVSVPSSVADRHCLAAFVVIDGRGRQRRVERVHEFLGDRAGLHGLGELVAWYSRRGARLGTVAPRQDGTGEHGRPQPNPKSAAIDRFVTLGDRASNASGTFSSLTR